MNRRTPGDLVAVVLAGGASKRFGRDKAAVDIDGVPSIQRVIQAASGCTSQVGVVGEPDVELSGVSFQISDMAPGEGPVQAVLSAFAELPGSDLLVLACDTPMVRVEHLSVLCRPLPEGYQARVPRSPEAPMPLTALYGADAAKVFGEQWEQGARSMRAVLKALRVEWVDWEQFGQMGLDTAGLQDFDTPQELRELRAYFSGNDAT